MPRPATKADLIAAANKNFETLRTLLSSLSDEEKRADIFPNERDKNVRDILVHLYEWHRLLIDWMKTNRNGVAASFLPEPYNWRTYPQMNIEFWKKHQTTPFEDAVNMLQNTHGEALALIESFSDEQLFVKNAFAWTGSATLGSYCVSSTSSHYDWAVKDIKKALKRYRIRNS
ncbi:MAG: ClbS/DfsB family four-helix bundle protein [Treponema sp.]